MESDALSPFGSDLKVYILEATRTWHGQHEFSDCRCYIACILHNNNVLMRGGEDATKIKSKQFSQFGYRAIAVS